MSKIGRNAPCPCGSGKKYKKCCLGKISTSGPTRVHTPTLHERNLILLTAIFDIFGLTRGVKWEDVKRNIAAEQIRELYKVVASLWPPNTDISGLLPTPNKGLRALYLGDTRPELLSRSVFRFGLYADEIFIVDPFHNPWCIAREYNPIAKPDQYKVDTLKLILFMYKLAPWIEAGFVTIIPDPADFSYDLRKKMWELAAERLKGWKPSAEDLEDFKPAMEEDLARFIFTLPKDYHRRVIQEVFPDFSNQQIQDTLDYIDQQREQDPLALDQPAEPGGGQLMISRSGANLEMALYIAQLTGAFPYTNFRHRWQELLSVKEDLPEASRVWSPLTKAFHDLEFKFLNHVDSQFACSMRNDGRMESFRAFLRRLWNTVGGQPDPTKIESIARDFRDELTNEYHKAEADWRAIDRELLTWAGPSLGAAIVSGGLNLAIPAFGFCVPAIFKLVESYLKRGEFRKKVPMSVFIDLHRSKSVE